MSQATTSTIHVTGLAKTKYAKLRRFAKQSGLSAEIFARQLIEDGLSLRDRAQNSTFEELLRPLRSEFKQSGTSEVEIDKIVDAARTRHYKNTRKKRA
jgi:hypothetical protein